MPKIINKFAIIILASLFTLQIAYSDVQYFYSDHLGSASVMTDDDGAVVQAIQYTPYGETIQESKVTSRQSPVNYLFTGQKNDLRGLSLFTDRLMEYKLRR